MLNKSLINTREVRSFRLRFRMLDLSSFLKEKETLGLFMFCYYLQPKDRQLLAETLNQREIQVNSISKTILKFSFLSEYWKKVKNLLEGGVVLVKDNKKKALSRENVKYMFEDKRFFFRLFFWEFRLSRTFLIINWLKVVTEKSARIAYITTVRSKIKWIIFLSQTHKIKEFKNA